MRSGDRYHSFEQLARQERGGGKDYRIWWIDRNSAVLIMAPHGGSIEPGTSEVAEALAGDEFSLYCFEGHKRYNNNVLHITSTHFNEPQALSLIRQSHTVVTVHGHRQKISRVYVGGVNETLQLEIVCNLRVAGFSAAKGRGSRAGNSSRNLCNRGRTRAGIQLELTQGLRRQFFARLKGGSRRPFTGCFWSFVETLRGTLLDYTDAVVN